ncbi:SAM-dependent methyltransferase [Hymenobacter lapidarius]|uniref:SAM-dependent methyltransferase n=1 Tax=Hymenobacter lapidarius TaxID=1908237 RepID=A0A1G1TC38_9BACT|nr:class I SAM-dependent methyltransferase [Hymenobacter lapidarius]OGX88430.1 SAM-dependent methyltransferase [Hymenobacter lapidarius]
MLQLLAYLRFWLRSGNAHGLHSPFVFGLYTSVVRHTGRYGAYEALEARRQELLASPTTISVTDFGAGSHTDAGAQRGVAAIARTAAKPPHLAQLLFRLVNYFRPATILELGTSLGLTTAYLAAADSRSRVVTLEGCPNVAAVARETFSRLHLGNVEVVEGNIDDTLAPTLSALTAPLDFAFFDGNHRYEPTLRYFEQCLAHRRDESVFVFDDIHWSADMERAWEVIKAHSDVTITVDLFYIGLVFFRTGQPKQHFSLRV